MSAVEGLVGREAELALAAAAVRRLGEGRASVLAIEGEAGISPDPFDRWFRDHVRKVHGIAWDEGTLPEPVLDFDTSRI